jgi:hypothetical protein
LAPYQWRGSLLERRGAERRAKAHARKAPTSYLGWRPKWRTGGPSDLTQKSFANVAGASCSPSIAKYSDASRRVRNLSSLTVAPESRVVVGSTAEAFDTE